MKAILESYLRRLTNLSGSNRSLLLLRLISDQYIDVHDTDFVLNQPSFSVIEGLISEKNRIPLCQAIDSRDKSNNELAAKLKKIQRIDKFIFEERGSKDLYVGWPFIKGKFLDGTLIRCPLIFWPVDLLLEDTTWYLTRRKDVNVTFNKSFLLAYYFFNKVPPDDEIVERVIDDLAQDATVFRTQIYELLKDRNLEINFNQENFLDKLTSFRNYRRNQLEMEEKDGKLKLYPEAVMGIFPQSGSYLVPDYTYLLEQESFSDIESFFAQRHKDDPEDDTGVRVSDRVLEENTYTPFELDAYQEKALQKIKKGNSLIVQGPPGTGKSQLIANLISDFTARGKNVLLVCQKRAALDVVHHRLKDKQVHDFVGLVHDFKNDRKSIFEKVDSQIEKLDEYRQKNNGLDAIHLERSFLQASRKIEALTEEIEEYRAALFDEKECGKSAKELYITTSAHKISVPLKQTFSFFTYDKVPEFESRLNRYFTYRKEFENKTHFWAHEKSFSKFQIGDFARIKEAVYDAVDTFKEFQSKSSELLHKELDYDSADFFLEKKESIRQFITNIDNEVAYRFFKLMLRVPPDEDQSWLVNLERTVLQCFKGSGPEISLKSSELGRFQEALEHAIKARKGLFSWIRWKLFSKDRIFITRVLVANDLKSNKEGFNVLLERIDNRLNLEHNLSIIEKKDWLMGFPKNLRKIDIQNWFFYAKLAQKTYLLLKELRNLGSYISFKTDNRKEQVSKLRAFLDLLETLPVHRQIWLNYLTHNQLQKIMNGRVGLEKVMNELDRDFEGLHDYHSLKDGFSNIENKVIEAIEEKTVDNKQAIALFRNSLGIAWIEHIEAKYPILRSVSSLQFDQKVKELREAVDQKRATSEEILILKLREKTYEDVEYNRLNNRVTYRDLQHQVTKKKKIWPLRKVIHEFSEELFKLIPCWMTSPESASAIFPMEELFDLVIFDEASQCFAERGIPAIYRGKQIVVAGDDKQLKPFDLYRVRWEDEAEEDIPELEIDSLLDLSRKYLASVSLKGHYRSKSLELIDFSNQHFYQSKLKMLPERKSVNKDIPAIHYVKVDGVWENNQNEEEAVRVVELIDKLRIDQPDKEIGVVTFNARQQSLILDLLDKKLTEWGSLPHGLFFFFIENVQGDEKDIIIFSIAYAPDKKGNIQLRFGSLNIEGGENRLNVAVTRAREAIYMVSSLLPGEMDTRNTKNLGPKLLKSYLEYAWNVSQRQWKPTLPPAKGFTAGWYLHRKIKQNFEKLNPGIRIDSILPFADLTLYDGHEYLGLIMTDDEMYHDAENIKDIYVYTPEIFLAKDWPYVQLSSRNYWLSPEKTEDKLRLYFNRISNDK